MNIPNAHVFWFQVVNHMCWMLMTIHIKQYRKFNRGIEYSEVKKSIRKLEVCLWFWNIFWYGIYVLILSFIVITQFTNTCAEVKPNDPEETGGGENYINKNGGMI